MPGELKEGEELLGCRIVRLLEFCEESDLYEAEDLHTAQRLAIERLLPSDDLRAYEMLRRRIFAFRPLSHPNLCAVYRVGEHAGLVCVIMEYLEGGRSLRKILRDGARLPLVAKLSVIRQTCDTLSYLHQNGFPFLNIRPANIILLLGGQIKVVDYWVGGFRARSNLTTKSADLGEIVYLAPERLRSVAHDHRADIWSIGVMLYQLLTNRSPFSEHDSAKLASILNDPFKPLKGVLEDYPAGLDAVLKKALAKNPENRYESSHEMGSALEEIEQTLVDPGRGPQSDVRSVTQLLRTTEAPRESPTGVTQSIERSNSQQTKKQPPDRPNMSPELWQRLKTLHAHALEMTTSEREQFVNEACGTDVRLREELKALLNSPPPETKDNAFLRLSMLFRRDIHALVEGESILGRFTVVKRLGAGGMGEVYEAIDSELGRIALKTIRPELTNQFQRFRKEVQLARKISSLHVCRVHEFFPAGRTNAQIHPAFLTMEFLEGETLGNRIRVRGQLDSREAVEIAIGACEGLTAIHEAGVIHRDLKSQNIMLALRNGRECVVLMDFGVAKELQVAPDSGAGELTWAGAIVGTPSYMAPEQFEGKHTSPATDVYALGIVLYEMLVGNAPYAASTPMGAAVQRGRQPSPVSSLRPDLSKDWDLVISKCLEFRAEDRYQMAADLKHDLESLLIIVTGKQTKASKPKRHYGGRLTIVSAAGALLAVGVAVIVVEQKRSTISQPQYERATFHPGTIASARFSSDTEMLLYSAAWGSSEIKLYSSRMNGTGTRSLDIPPCQLLSVAHSGELAIKINETGRLARVTTDGTAPRELLDHVVAADWSPDSTRLAVARFQEGQYRLEYPIGKVLYKTSGYIDSVRVSPRGNTVAFMEHPSSDDDRGTVVLLDLNGNKRTLTSEWISEEGLAWSPDGREVWFTAASIDDWNRALYAVTLSGRQRLVLRTPGPMILEDIAPDGRTLLKEHDRRHDVLVKDGAETRRLNWLPLIQTSSISRDGKYAVITDWSGTKGGNYTIYLAKLDGSPAVQLGEGIGGDISQDDKWVTSILPHDPTKIQVLSTGVDDVKVITASNFSYREAHWASDGRRLVVLASQSGRPFRFWVQDIAGGVTRAVTPEGVPGVVLRVNHSDFIAVRDDDTGGVHLYPIDGGSPRQVAGVTKLDTVIGGTPVSNYLYVSRDTSSPDGIEKSIWKINVATGHRLPFVTISTRDSDGVVGLARPYFSDDGKRYIVTEGRSLSALYVATGLK